MRYRLPLNTIKIIESLENELGFKLQVIIDNPEERDIHGGIYIEDGTIRELRLRSYGLEKLPPSISTLCDLVNLYLEENYLTELSLLANLSNLEGLNLTENRLTDISGLGKLKKLRHLNLSMNSISDISPLVNLKKLEKLFLAANNLSDISPLSCLKRLDDLSLSENELSDVSALSGLVNLKSLNLDANQLSSILPLQDLPELTVLDLGSNRLTDVSPLMKLKKLQNLILINNNLTDVHSLSDLKKLTTLDLENNRLTDISPLSKLTKLTSLDLSKNQVTDVSALSKLKKLEDLYLSNNCLTNIDALKENDNWDTLHLDSNCISHYPEWFFGLKRFSDVSESYFNVSLDLSNNPIENIPAEILNQGRDAIKDYFKSLEEGAQPVNEIKVILLGEGAAGKTSLMNYLKGKPYNKNQSQTHGINLEECTGEKGVIMKIWDFGGQDIMHHTHQFFLTQKSVYVLVLNARENTDTEKWLKLIQVFGGDSPIIVVTNKIDENPSDHENIKYLNTKYPGINNRYVRISCEKGTGLDEFRSILIDTIKDQLHVRTLWANSWIKVKKELEQMRNGDSLKDYIHFDKFEEICDKNGVAKTHRDTLINSLHQLGVITYFPDHNLSETNVINPSWLTQAFYAIINSENIAKSFGRLNLAQLPKILNANRYPKHKYSYLLGLMTKFELCYKIDEHDFLIPDLLSKEEPVFDFDIRSALKFKYKYSNLLPKSVLPKFMVRRHAEISDDKKWRTGLLINDTYFESKALIRVDEEDKEVSVYVNGQERRGYLASIISSIEGINRIYEGLEYAKLVPCCCDECSQREVPHYFRYDVLLKAKQNGRKEYPCEISVEDVSINKLLGVLITQDELEAQIKSFIGKGSFNIKKYIENGNTEKFIDTIKTLFSSVSYLLFEKKEKAYHLPLFILLRSIFSDNAHADEIQSKGRADIVINVKRYIYILELKLDDSAKTAMDQIHENRYYEPYLQEDKKIVLLAINFSSKERNISNYIVEQFNA